MIEALRQPQVEGRDIISTGGGFWINLPLQFFVGGATNPTPYGKMQFASRSSPRLSEGAVGRGSETAQSLTQRALRFRKSWGLRVGIHFLGALGGLGVRPSDRIPHAKGAKGAKGGMNREA